MPVGSPAFSAIYQETQNTCVTSFIVQGRRRWEPVNDQCNFKDKMNKQYKSKAAVLTFVIGACFP